MPHLNNVRGDYTKFQFSTAKVISTACPGIVYLLGMLFMQLNFIQVQSANIISMLHLDNVRGD